MTAPPGPLLTGDYLAELTMLILGRVRMKYPERGYAKTFLNQLKECMGLAHDRVSSRTFGKRGICSAMTRNGNPERCVDPDDNSAYWATAHPFRKTWKVPHR